MKINFRLSTAIIILCCVTPTYAMFCPTNFNEIKEGDSIDTVQLKCGKADQEKTYESKPDKDYYPQEWSYMIRPSPVSQNGMRVSFIFQDKKAASITVNGYGMSQTQICGSMVQLGDSMEKIKKACGGPIFINRSSDTDTMSKSALQQLEKKEIKELSYTNIAKPVTLIFENGIFKGTK